MQENNIINTEVIVGDKVISENGITEGQQDSGKEEDPTNLPENSEIILSKIEENSPENSTKQSPVVSTSNLNAIQEESNHDETTNGLLSLDVTIAVEDGAIDSQNTTQDILTDKYKATQSAIQSESRVLSIKSAQVLRARALSRLANVDLNHVITRSNTPLDYTSPGLPWNVDFISIEQFSQLTEFFWGKYWVLVMNAVETIFFLSVIFAHSTTLKSLILIVYGLRLLGILVSKFGNFGKIWLNFGFQKGHFLVGTQFPNYAVYS